MYKDIIIWSLGPEALAGKITSMNAFQTAKAAGFGGVELALHENVGDISVKLKKDYQGKLVRDGVEKTVQVENVIKDLKQTELGADCLSTGLCWDYSLSANDKLVRKTAVNIAKAQIEIASDLLLSYVLVVPGAVKVTFDKNSEKVPYNKVWDRVSKAIGEELLPLAEEKGIIIALENVGNDFLLTPKEFRKFIKQFNSDDVRMYFDMANVMYNSDDKKLGNPIYWVNELSDLIARVHVKDYMLKQYGTKNIKGLGCYLGEGDVPLKATVDALRKAGYDGSLTAEIVLFGKPEVWKPDVPTRTSEAMDRLLKEG